MSRPTVLDLTSRSKALAGSHWIKAATKNSHGQFRKRAEAAGMSTSAFAKKEEHAPGLIGEQARLAETLMGLPHGKKSTKAPIFRKKS